MTVELTFENLRRRLYSEAAAACGLSILVCCSVLQYVAVCCSVLQYVAVCCSVLQCVAVCTRRSSGEQQPHAHCEIGVLE